MNCFNHGEVTAVATCIDCNKGLCSTCASNYSITICTNCNNVRLGVEKRNMNKQLIMYGIAATLGILSFIPGLANMITQPASFSSSNLFLLFVLSFGIAGIPWGWNALTMITPRMFIVMPLVGWFVYFVAKLILSAIIGAFIMPVKAAQMFMNAKKLKDKIKSTQNK